MIINIGRQLASGGKTIGSLLAKKFNMAYYDKDLLRIAAEESGLTSEAFERIDEQPNKNLLSSFMGFTGIGGFTALGLNYNYNTGLSDQELFRIQSDVIRQLADKRPSVFVGRCSDYILRSRTDCLNIFFYADMQNRIDRVRRNNPDMTEKQASKIIEETDKIRSQYYNFYTNKQWGHSSSYHLCINTSVLGVEQTAVFLEEYIRQVEASRK